MITFLYEVYLPCVNNFTNLKTSFFEKRIYNYKMDYTIKWMDNKVWGYKIDQELEF